MTFIRWFLIAVFLFGVATTDFSNPKWAAMQLALFALPLLALFIRIEAVTITAVWTAVLLVVQTLISPLALNSNYKTLPPNYDVTIDVKSGLPGISGKQQITTDSKGFRTTVPIDYAKDTPYRVFAIGASTTEEIVLDNTRTWTAGLQSWLRTNGKPQAEVINTGLAGLRAVHHLATLQAVLQYKPDAAIFLVGINDWNHHIRAHYDAEHRSILDRVRHSLSRTRAAYQLETTLLGRAIHVLYVAVGLVNPRPKFRDENGEYFVDQRGSLNKADKISFMPDGVAADYADMLNKIAATCKANKIKCMFISQPHGYQDGASQKFKNGFWMTPTDAKFTVDFKSIAHIASLYNRHLEAAAKEHGIAFCDAAAKLPASYDAFYDDCHFNEAGSKLMSRAVQSCFSRAGM